MKFIWFFFINSFKWCRRKWIRNKSSDMRPFATSDIQEHFFMGSFGTITLTCLDGWKLSEEITIILPQTNKLGVFIQFNKRKIRKMERRETWATLLWNTKCLNDISWILPLTHSCHIFLPHTWAWLIETYLISIVGFPQVEQNDDKWHDEN